VTCIIRTNIELDEELLAEGLRLSSLKAKKQLVNTALSEYVKRLRRKRLAEYAGSGIWRGNLDELRSTRI